MEQPEGNPCPECGAPRNSDNTPSCACTARAADALRDARTAEAAAAEDFDPLRIRPYVELDGTAADSTPDGAPEGDTARRPADATMPLRAVAPMPPGLPTPLGPPPGRPNEHDLHLFEATPPAADDRPDADGDPFAAPPPRRRRTALLAAAGAVVTVIGAAAWASGLFAYETPTRDKAMPDDIRASVPDAPSTEPSPAASSSAPSASPSSASPSASASATTSPPTSPSPSASSSSPAPSRTAEPSTTPPTSAPAESAEDPGEGERAAPAPVLRRGDQGDEVVELQLRLRQLSLYNDEIHGHFNRRVEDALRTYQRARGLREEPGVYGPETRALLESETREP